MDMHARCYPDTSIYLINNNVLKEVIYSTLPNYSDMVGASPHDLTPHRDAEIINTLFEVVLYTGTPVACFYKLLWDGQEINRHARILKKNREIIVYSNQYPPPVRK